jgi:RHS repeat-associated protein
MPDGSTSYTYLQRATNGLPTEVVESWCVGSTALTRTNTFIYDPSNTELLAWTNALGVLAVSNMYNALHQVVTNFDALGQVTTNGYDPTTHQITSTRIPSGLATTYSYDGNHRLQQITDQPINATRSFTWNTDGTLATYTDERGLTVTNFWDGLHRPTGTAYPDGTATTNLYYVISGTSYPNSSGGTAILDRTATKDRMGFWTYFTYDALRRIIFVTNANSVVTAYGYCDCGSVSYMTNALGSAVQQTNSYAYDNQGNRIYSTFSDGYIVTNWFDSLGRTTVTGDGTGYRWSFYDNLNRLTTISNAIGVETAFTFDAANRKISITDAKGVSVTNTYDQLDRLTVQKYPDGGTNTFGFAPSGMTAFTNQIGMVALYLNDAAGRKTFETNANTEILQFTYNAAGDLLTLTDGKNQTTTWHYDGYGRETNKLDQTGTEILRYAYDPDNRLTNRWSAAKLNTAYSYDNLGNLTLITYPVTHSVALTYDALNRLTKMVDGVGTNNYTYTSGNQLLSEGGVFASDLVTNGYVNRLRTGLGLQQPTGEWTNGFSYDAAQRFNTIKSPAGTFSYYYKTGAQWLMSGIALPNTSFITNFYDSDARLTATYLKTSGGSTLDSAIYGYDLANQRKAFTNDVSVTFVLYNYDNIGQLRVADSSVNTEDRGYTYDAAWNLNWLTNNGSKYHFLVDTKNELTNAYTSTYGYDANGNLISGTNGHTSFVYDDENRLIQWFWYGAGSGSCSNGAARTDFIYDGLGRLRKRIEYSATNSAPPPAVPGGLPPSSPDCFWSLGPETRYIYDGKRVIQERDGNNNLLVNYTRGPDLSGSLEGAGGIGGLLARSDRYFSGNLTNHNYYHADGNGNITYLVNGSQGLAASYRYDPFGKTTSSSGTLASMNVYRFSSKEVHANSGMYYYLYRFYDPNLQRWINRDPAGEEGGINLYECLQNNPINNLDDDGQQAINGPVTPPSQKPPRSFLPPPPVIKPPETRPVVPKPVVPKPVVPKPVVPIKPRPFPILGPLCIFIGEMLDPPAMGDSTITGHPKREYCQLEPGGETMSTCLYKCPSGAQHVTGRPAGKLCPESGWWPIPGQPDPSK